MASFTETKYAYKIRFYKSRRTPKEKSISLNKAAWTKREAKRHKRELVVLYDKGEFDPWTQPTPGQEAGSRGLLCATKKYIEAKTEAGRRAEAGGWTEKTRKGNETVLLDFARRTGARKRLADVTTADLSAHIHQKGLAHATKRGYRRKLKAMFRWFEQHLGAGAPPIPPPLEKRRRLPPYLTEAQLDTLCKKHRELAAKSAARNSDPDATSDRQWMIDLYWWRLYEGERPAESITKRVGGVDLERNLVTVGDEAFIPKNKSEGVIPLVKPARPLARKLCTDENGQPRAPTERLFGHTSFKKTSDAFREALRKSLPELGRVPFYNLRHSCGVYWRRRGVPLSTIQELLRHADPKTTQIYAVIEPLDVGRIFDQAYDAFEDIEGDE